MAWRKTFKLTTWQRAVKYWSPDAWLVFFALLLIATNLTLTFRTHFIVPFWLSGVGILIIPLALAIIIGGQAMVTSAHEKGEELVTRGIYHYSRHPMYLGFVLLFIGVGLGRDLLWFIIVGVTTPVAFNYFVLPAEEKETARFYGKAWKAYAAKTPRWL